MSTNTDPHPAAAFEDPATRAEDMRESIGDWLHELTVATDEARASEAFQSWLDVQSRFHDYSYRNTLLIKCQCPEATRVAGYRTWQEEFDRHVCEGERAIWIWAPIITKQCPACGNSASYHARRECEYDETPSEDWSTGLVGFKPVPVFDVSQTEGEPLPELETAASGNATNLVPTLERAARHLGVSVSFVPHDEWPQGGVKGVCQWPNTWTGQPRVDVNAGLATADLAVTLVHEYAHALLHAEDPGEQAKREVEAEAVAYVVGRHFDLDVGGSGFYVAAWSDEATSTIEDRLDRISGTAETIIDAVE